MTSDWKRMFELKQEDWLEACKEVDRLREERDEALRNEQSSATAYAQALAENAELRRELSTPPHKLLSECKTQLEQMREERDAAKRAIDDCEVVYQRMVLEKETLQRENAELRRELDEALRNEHSSATAYAELRRERDEARSDAAFYIDRFMHLSMLDECEMGHVQFAEDCINRAHPERTWFNERDTLSAAVRGLADAGRELLRVDDEWHGSVNSEMASARSSMREALAAHKAAIEAARKGVEDVSR